MQYSMRTQMRVVRCWPLALLFGFACNDGCAQNDITREPRRFFVVVDKRQHVGGVVFAAKRRIQIASFCGVDNSECDFSAERRCDRGQRRVDPLAKFSVAGNIRQPARALDGDREFGQCRRQFEIPNTSTSTLFAAFLAENARGMASFNIQPRRDRVCTSYALTMACTSGWRTTSAA